MNIMQAEGVNLRRGQRKANQGKIAGNLFFYCLTGIIFLLFVITWFVINEKTNKSLHDIADATAEARNLGAMRKAPPGQTSLVQCTVQNPHDASSSFEGVLTITVRHDLSPLHSKIFLQMVTAHHFDGTFIFRVLHNFIAQWGIRHKEIEHTAPLPDPQPHNIKDVVTPDTMSNTRGTLSFAGGNPATKQVFVNLGDNERLDKENSRPFATVDEASMTVLDQLYHGYQEGQGQVKALTQLGLAGIQEQFPKWSQIGHCQVIQRYKEEGQ